MMEVSTETLMSRCVKHVVTHLGDHEDDLESLPNAIKDRMLYLMSKRGLLTDNNIAQMLHARIRILDLNECEVSDAALQMIAVRCPGLRKIDLNSAKSSRTSITSQGIITLAEGCKHLSSVYLRRCLNVDDAAIIHLSECCPLLRELNIGGCTQVTDRALESLGQNCKHLRNVNFSRASVTDFGVVALSSQSLNIEEIHMDGCKALTDEAVEALLHYCPKIRILIFHGCPKITDGARLALEVHQASVSDPNLKLKQVTWSIY